MTDRELLEAAAKAIGHRVACTEADLHGCTDESTIYTGVMLHGVQEPWNPLTDDGDALRLLVLLDMEIHGGRKPVNFREVIFMLEGEPHSEEIAPYDLDQNAATRRAITRAAAAIGGAA